MSKIKILNIEQTAPLKIKISLDQNVLTDFQYYDLNNYLINPYIQFNSIESYPTSSANYIILNLEYPLVNNTFYKITLDENGIKNVLGESFEFGYNFYNFISSSSKPIITTIVVSDEKTIRLTYDRPYSTSALNIDNYDIYSDFNGHNIYFNRVEVISPYVVDLHINTNKSYMTNGFYHTLTLNDISDISGNLVDESITYSFIGIATTFTKLTDIFFDNSFEPDRITLTFDQELEKVNAENQASYSITSATGYLPFISSVNLTGENKVVVLEISETTGSQTYTIECTQFLTDIYGNVINASFKSKNFVGSGHKPTLEYITYVSNSVLEVHFDEHMRDNQYSRDVLNYIFDNGLVATKVLKVSESKATLNVSNFVKGITYNLSITNPGFIDRAGNVLNFPATAFINVPVEEDYADKGIVLYNFLTEGLRNTDQSKQLERFVDVFQNQFDKNIKSVKEIYNLISLAKVDDKYLKYFLLENGWYGYEDIFNIFNSNEIRYILKLSHSLWKRRGASGSYTEVLNTLLGVDSYEDEFFESRSILEESTYLTNEHGFTDFVLIDHDDFYNMHLNITDPDNTVNRGVLEKLVYLFKPSIEKVTLCYYKLFELFDSKFVATKYIIAENNATHTVNTLYVVQDGLLKFSQAAKYESIYSSNQMSKSWTSRFKTYANFTPKTFAVSSDSFFIAIKHNNGLDDHYLISITFNNELKITRTNTAVSVTVNLGDFDFTVLNDKTYGLTVEFEELGALDYIKVLFEGILVYSGSHTKVTSTGNICAGKSAKECWISEFRISDMSKNSTKEIL